MKLRNWLVLGFLVLVVAPESVYMPFLSRPNFRKGVALAYGWHANPNGREILGTGSHTRWSIQNSGQDDVRELQVFWDTCWKPSPGECVGDYIADLQWLAAQTDYSQMITHNGRVVVKFLNEPDNASQAARPPIEAAALWQQVTEICPHCLLTFPAVSAWDMHCDWPQSERLAWHAEIDDGGMWCWSRAFLAELSGESFELCNIHHYYSIDWHHPKRDLAPMEPAESLAGVVGCNSFVVSEYGTCSPEFMREMTQAYNDDPRVVAYFAWVPNRPQNGCDVFFDWHTGALTPLGAAFAEAGR